MSALKKWIKAASQLPEYGAPAFGALVPAMQEILDRLESLEKRLEKEKEEVVTIDELRNVFPYPNFLSKKEILARLKQIVFEYTLCLGREEKVKEGKTDITVLDKLGS